MAVLSLNCYLFGRPIGDIFEVEIEGTKKISDLKDRIESRYPDVAKALDLDIFQASILCDDIEKMREDVQNTINSATTLINNKRLSCLFPGNPDEDYLHIIAKLPPSYETLNLFCMVQSDAVDEHNVFSVELKGDQTVGHLKGAIKKQNENDFKYIDADKLVLYQVSIPHGEDFEETLRSTNLKGMKPISSTHILSRVFPSAAPGHVHVIIQVPSFGKPIGSSEVRRDEIIALSDRFRNLISSILKTAAPSESSKSSMCSKSLAAHSIIDGRYDCKEPKRNFGPPLEIYHEAFRHFSDNIKRVDIPPDDDIIRKTVAYMQAASAIYPDEAARTAALKPLLQEIIGTGSLINAVYNDDQTRADGIIELEIDGVRIIFFLKEHKNEFGDGGCDPSTQTGVSAARHWAQAKYERYRNATCCPIFLLATAGPWIMVLGSVITDSVIIQRLTDCVWVGLDAVPNDPQIFHVARIFSALKKGLSELRQYYMNLKPVPRDGITPARFFPSTTVYHGDSGSVDFEYVGYLENVPDCVTLRARTCDEPVRDIVVKFVDRYGERAHRLLADHDLAPKLLYHGPLGGSSNQQSSHRLSMVVMDYIEGETLAKVKQDERMDEKVAKEVRSKVKEALDLLHGNGLVFGDLRPPNVIIAKTGEAKVKLIDFNWADVHGQAKYPCLIAEGNMWPEGVKARHVIEPEHDLEMFERLFR